MYNQMLRGRIIQKYGSLRKFVDPMGLSYPTILAKISGATDWTVPEIQKMCKLLEILPKEIPVYFFTNEV